MKYSAKDKRGETRRWLLGKNDLSTTFRAVLERHGWLGDSRPVLLAVSGGSDSMSLLRLFYLTLGPEKIAVVHMNHGLRDTASRDSDFVARVCAELGVKCVIERRSVSLLKRQGESEESAGRRLRYELYSEVRQRLGCGYVALGHTRNDLAENVLMNLARGCGLWGLGGMPRQRDCYIRPLLAFSRGELRDFLTAHSWSWIEDESNDTDQYQRNRVRRQVIPLMERTVNSAVAEHLADLAEEAQAWRDEEDAEARELLAQTCGPVSTWPCLNLKKLRTLRPFQLTRLLRYLGRRLELGSLSRPRTEELCRLVAASGRWTFQWGSAVDIGASKGLVTLHPASEKYSSLIQLPIGGKVRWGGWEVTAEPLAGEPEEWDLGFSCPLDPSKPLFLERNDERSGLCDGAFPRIFQNDVFSAQKLPKLWEINHHGVEYRLVHRVVLRPLVGIWREELWSSDRQRF